MAKSLKLRKTGATLFPDKISVEQLLLSAENLIRIENKSALNAQSKSEIDPLASVDNIPSRISNLNELKSRAGGVSIRKSEFEEAAEKKPIVIPIPRIQK